MTRKHDAIFDDVLSGLDATPEPGDRAGSRFLKRTTSIGERLSGEIEEKTLRWVDPARCIMWARHNRNYALLNEENCRDLIDGIRAQGRQEFPAIVRPVKGDRSCDYEVICGARRHFAITWLRQNAYTQFNYLVEVRDLTDEEAFRLADIENREREDISDYERAIDYADACERYYGGKQKAMAARLEVSEPWLSRYLQLARLPFPVVQAFASVRDIRERHARDLKPLLADPETAKLVMHEANRIRGEQGSARDGKGPYIDAAAVIRRLTRAAKPKPQKPAVETARYGDVAVRRKGQTVTMEFNDSLSRGALEEAFQAYLDSRD